MKFAPFKEPMQKNKKARWMVSYSDFTTVLLALFMVLTVSSNVKVKELENALNKESIQFVCPERVVDITISDNEKIYVYKRLKLHSFF